MITDEGVIYESEPIMRYIARLSPDFNLYGASNFEAGLIDQWMCNTASINGGVFGQFLRVIAKWQPDDAAYKAANESFAKAIKPIDDHLALRTYLVGNQVSIADMSFISILYPAFSTVYTRKDRSKFKNVSRYFDHITSLPFFTSTFGNVRSHTKAYKQLNPEDWTAPDAATNMPAKKGNGKDAQKGGKKQKQQQKKKEKKPEQPKAQPKKQKRTFIQSEFNLESFKSKIINAKGDEKVAVVKDLLTNLDTKGKKLLESEI